MRRAAAVFGLLVAACMTATCQAVVFTYTASDRPGASPDANSGTVNAWLVTVTSPGNGSVNGDFIGNSAGNGDGSNTGGTGAGSSAWAMYANSGNTTSARASAPDLATKALDTAGEFISLDFDNGFIEGGGIAGITFLNASDQSQLTFRFTGGTSNYRIDDSTSNFDTGIGFTDNGFNVKLTLNDSTGGYTLNVGPSTFSSRTLAQGTSNISAIRVFNQNAGFDPPRNVYFNNLVISAVPEASPALAIPFAVVISGGVAVLIRKRRLAT